MVGKTSVDWPWTAICAVCCVYDCMYIQCVHPPYRRPMRWSLGYHVVHRRRWTVQWRQLRMPSHHGVIPLWWAGNGPCLIYSIWSERIWCVCIYISVCLSFCVFMHAYVCICVCIHLPYLHVSVLKPGSYKCRAQIYVG